MNVATESSAPGSAGLPNNDTRPDPQKSEVDYLKREISDARAALLNTVARLKDRCAASVDAREWIIQYPWAAMGIAALAGFTAATVVAPAPGVPFSEKWSELRTKFCPNSSPDSDRASSYSQARRGRIAATILGSLFDLTKLLLESVIIAALRNPTASQEQGDAQSSSVDPPDCE
jgi:hypothetical protein